MNTHLEINQYHAFVGIDWADDKHDICLQDLATNKRELSVIEHKPKNIDTWANNHKKRFGDPIAVAVELSKGPWRSSKTPDIQQALSNDYLKNRVCIH